MVRKQIYLRRDQDRRLKRIARSLGVSEAEFIRRSLDQAVAQPVAAEEVPTPDPNAWNEVLDFLRRRHAKGDLPGARDWKREDLYERPLPRRH